MQLESYLAVIFVVIPVVAIFAQIHLSKKENERLGLIPPITTFVLALLIFFLSIYIAADGYNAFAMAVNTLILLNIPTAIFFTIHKIIRYKRNQQHDVEKMSIQDL